MWYPEFKLKENPFEFYDYTTERDYFDKVPYIQTKAIKWIRGLAEGRVTCGIFGDRGVGKSTETDRAVEELKKSERFTKIFSCVSPSSEIGIYNDLFEQLIPRIENSNTKTSELDVEVIKSVVRDVIDDTWFEYGRKKEWDGSITKVAHFYCQYPECYRQKKRCEIPLDFKSEKHETRLKEKFSAVQLIHKLRDITTFYCPLKLMLTEGFARDLRAYEGKFLFIIDLPDNLSNVRVFMNLISKIRLEGRVILIGLRDAKRLLEKDDDFRRFPMYEFWLMTNEELKQLYEARIKWQQKGEYMSPLDDDALDLVVKGAARNPRKLIQTLSSLLMAARTEGRSDVIDCEFVNNSKVMVMMTVDEAIDKMIEKYYDMKAGWVSVDQSINDLCEWFNICGMTTKALGRRLKKRYRKNKMPIDWKHLPEGAFYLYSSDGEKGKNVNG